MATSPRWPATRAPARRSCSAPPPSFLERLGLDSLDDLPSLAEFVPGPDVVEALEQGLRVDPADELLADDDGPTTPTTVESDSEPEDARPL